MTPTYVLGTGLSHDGSSCLLKDGRIAAAIEKERLTRVKHDGFNDAATMRYCLDAEGIGFEDVALVVENNTRNRFESDDQRRRRGRIVPPTLPVINISHHLAHAYSAIASSPFVEHEAAVVVMDGRGSSLDNCLDAPPESLPSEIRSLPAGQRDCWWERESLYRWTGRTLVPVHKDFAALRRVAAPHLVHPMLPPTLMHGVAEFYGGVTWYVFDDDFAQGKLMGLAPYGRPGRVGRPAFDLRHGRAFVRHETLLDFPAAAAARQCSFRDEFQRFADIAHWAQSELERAIIELFASYAERVTSERVAYAGGLALNAVANGKLRERTPFRDLYVQPAAGDGGVALGCAYYGWMHELGRAAVRHDGGTAFGRTYGDAEVDAAVAAHGARLVSARLRDVAEETADLLAAGQVVAWFQGASEYGPRALGRRSILADPRDARMRDRINREIKLREDFRPFAPAVPLEAVSTYFDADFPSPYMLQVRPVRPRFRAALPAVTHVDGTARLQTVTADAEPVFHRLLVAFGRRVGLPVLVNTSLNRRGMPIVETPRDAVDFFAESALDALVIGDRLVICAADPSP